MPESGRGAKPAGGPVRVYGMRTGAAFGGRQARGVSRADERLATIYSERAGDAVRLAYLLTRDHQAAEDIAHEAFVRLGGKLLTLRDPERAAGYLLRTVANLAKDHGRRLARARAAGAVGSEASEPAHIDVELRDEVFTALAAIPPRQRMVLFLRYYLDMSEQQASQTMGCTTAAVKSLTNRAASSLRKQLEGGSRE